MTRNQTQPLDPFSRLVVGVFRLNGALIAAGDRLVADLNLTSARWQVLGAAATAPVPLPMASIARNMGLTRQTVRATVRELEADGFVHLVANPHHQRAHLVTLTPAGDHAYAAAMKRQAAWAQEVGRGVEAAAMSEAADVLGAVLAQLGDERPDDPP